MAVIGRVLEIWRYPVKSMAGERLDQCSVGLAGIPGDRGWALRDDTAGEIRGARKFPILMQCSSRYRAEPTDAPIPHVDMLLPDGSRIGSDDPTVSTRLSQLVGRPVTLWPIQPASNKAHYRRARPGSALIGRFARTKTARRLLLNLMRYTGMDADLREELSRQPNEPLPDLSDNPAEVFEFASRPGTYFDAFPVQFLTTASLAAMASINPAAAWDVRRFRPNFLVETNSHLKGLVESNWTGRTLSLGSLRLQCEIPTVRCGMTTHAQENLPKDLSILRTIVRGGGQNLGMYAGVICPGQVCVGDAIELL